MIKFLCQVRVANVFMKSVVSSVLQDPQTDQLFCQSSWVTILERKRDDQPTGKMKTKRYNFSLSTEKVVLLQNFSFMNAEKKVTEVNIYYQ